MQLANTENDYAQIMATEAEKRLKSAIDDTVKLRGLVEERLVEFRKKVGRNVSIQELKNASKFADSKQAEEAYTLYRRLKDSSRIVKDLNRGLGGLVSTDPKFYADEGLLDALLDVEPGRADKLKKVLNNWDNKIAGYGNKVKDKVGHHPTALSTLREALLGKDPNYRKAFKKMALEQGYEIGEEFNLTRERVRQIKEKAIRRLRHRSRSKTLRTYLG